MAMRKKCFLLLLVILFSSNSSLGSTPLPAVTSDWAVAETLSILGVSPLAVAQLRNYQDWTGNEIITGEGIDIGLKPMPNLELIADHEPELLIGGNQILLQHFSDIAPTLDISLYPFTNNPWKEIIDFTFKIGEHLDLTDEAQVVITQANQQLDTLNRKIKDKNKTILLVQFRDDRHAWVYGKNSLLGGVIDRLGLTNAWDRPTSDIGLSVVSIDALARSEGHLFIIESPAYQDRIGQQLESSAIWRELISQREEKITYLQANYWPIGALPSALKFAESFTAALLTSESHLL